MCLASREYTGARQYFSRPTSRPRSVTYSKLTAKRTRARIQIPKDSLGARARTLRVFLRITFAKQLYSSLHCRAHLSFLSMRAERQQRHNKKRTPLRRRIYQETHLETPPNRNPSGCRKIRPYTLFSARARARSNYATARFAKNKTTNNNATFANNSSFGEKTGKHRKTAILLRSTEEKKKDGARPRKKERKREK